MTVEERLQGKWMLEKAERNGKTTQTLSNLFFEFAQDSMYTNLFGEDEAYFFEVVENNIGCDSDLRHIDLQIMELKNQLRLQTEIARSSFVFYLKEEGGIAADVTPEVHLASIK